MVIVKIPEERALSRRRRGSWRLRRRLAPLIPAVLAAAFAALICFSPLSAVAGRALEAGRTARLSGGSSDPARLLASLSFPGMGAAFPAPAGASAGASPAAPDTEASPPAITGASVPLFEADDASYDGAAAGGAQIRRVPSSGASLPTGMYPITPVDLSGQNGPGTKLLLNNQTHYNVNLEDYLARPYPIPASTGDGPLVLILDTHATESYRENGAPLCYSPAFTAERSGDPDHSVMVVATALRETLEAADISVVQSYTQHDKDSYNAAYSNALKTINDYLTKYPSIRYVFDVHRDSVILATGEKYKPVINVNGRDAAQAMLVVGTSEGGAAQPHWQDNLTFAVKLQEAVNQKYPGLMRPINLRSSRFNQQATKGSLIIEVGSCGCCFDEAIYSAQLFGGCIAELIKGNGAQ